MNTALPPLLYDVTAVLTLATAAFLVAGHAILAALAARRSAAGEAGATAPWLVAGYLAVWLALALAAADAAHFPSARPLRRLLLLGAVSLVPAIVAAAVVVRSRTLRALHAAMEPAWLVRLQTYRAAGLMFLWPLLAYGVLPAGFAIPAALGDAATGLAAPWVASRLAQGRPGARAWALAWNVFGIADLIVAPAAAVLSGALVLQSYPLALVPLFLGPPLGILTHLCSLRNLSLTEARGGLPDVGRGSAASAT